MRRITSPVRRAAIAAALLPILWACGSGDPAAVVVPTPRVFTVMQADGQGLPAHRPCPAPVEGMITGTAFVEGELILYPERTFTWRYTIEQYATAGETEEAWVEPILVRGTYLLHGDSLRLAPEAGAAREALVVEEILELTEALPCHFDVEGHVPHQARLRLQEQDPGD